MADTSPPAVPLGGRSQAINSGPVRLCGPVPFAVTLLLGFVSCCAVLCYIDI